mgnify:CR=1 FL=1
MIWMNMVTILLFGGVLGEGTFSLKLSMRKLGLTHWQIDLGCILHSQFVFVKQLSMEICNEEVLEDREEVWRIIWQS